MLEQLRLHTMTHLRFFMRSRLVLGLALLMLVVWGLSFVPFLLMDSSGGRFERLQSLTSQLHSLAWAYGGLLTLLTMSTHLRDRMTRLVFTRPAPPEIWVASVMLSAFLVSAAAHLGTAALTLVLSLAWDLPYQAGFLWLALDATMETTIILSIFGAVAAAVHPAAAVLIVLFLNEDLFQVLLVMLGSAVHGGEADLWVRAAEMGARGLYAVLPMLDPFAEQTRTVEWSVRATAIDWAYLGATTGYALAMAAGCFFTAVWVLRRRPL